MQLDAVLSGKVIAWMHASRQYPAARLKACNLLPKRGRYFHGKFIAIQPLLPGLPFASRPGFPSGCGATRDLHPWYTWSPRSEPIGEAWLTGDQCVVATGAHAGQTLGALFAENPEALLGRLPPAQSRRFAAADQGHLCQGKAERAGASGRRDGAEVWRSARQDGVLVRVGRPSRARRWPAGSSRASR